MYGNIVSKNNHHHHSFDKFKVQSKTYELIFCRKKSTFFFLLLFRRVLNLHTTFVFVVVGIDITRKLYWKSQRVRVQIYGILNIHHFAFLRQHFRGIALFSCMFTFFFIPIIYMTSLIKSLLCYVYVHNIFIGFIYSFF